MLIPVIAVLFLTSCKKDAPVHSNEGVTGSAYLVQTTGSPISAAQVIFYAPEAHDSVQISRNGTLVKTDKTVGSHVYFSGTAASGDNISFVSFPGGIKGSAIVK